MKDTNALVDKILDAHAGRARAERRVADLRLRRVVVAVVVVVVVDRQLGRESAVFKRDSGGEIPRWKVRCRLGFAKRVRAAQAVRLLERGLGREPVAIPSQSCVGIPPKVASWGWTGEGETTSRGGFATWVRKRSNALVLS